MPSKTIQNLSVLTCATLLNVFTATAAATTLRGWIADEPCASGRANGGIFTGTNPECAKDCIAKGAKTVLVDSDNKRLLVVDNPAAAKENIGDYVEVQGTLDSDAKVLHIDSLKLLEKGVAECDRKAHH